MKLYPYLKKQLNIRGVLVVITALILPVFILFVGMALDFGMLYVQRAKLQDIADAAAYAGASQMNITGDDKEYKNNAERKNVAKYIVSSVKQNDSDFAVVTDESDTNYVNKYLVPDYNVSSGADNSALNNIIENVWKKSPQKQGASGGETDVLRDKKLLIEYSISGAILVNGETQGSYNALETKLRTFALEDRVRVRLTKRARLFFLGALLSNEYGEGVPITVSAAATGPTGHGPVYAINNNFITFYGDTIISADSAIAVITGYNSNLYLPSKKGNVDDCLKLYNGTNKINMFFSGDTTGKIGALKYSGSTTTAAKTIDPTNATEYPNVILTTDVYETFTQAQKQILTSEGISVGDTIHSEYIFECRNTKGNNSRDLFFLFEKSIASKFSNKENSDVICIYSAYRDNNDLLKPLYYVQEMWAYIGGELTNFGNCYDTTKLPNISDTGFGIDASNPYYSYCLYLRDVAQNAVDKKNTILNGDSSNGAAYMLTNARYNKALYDTTNPGDNKRYMEITSGSVSKTNLKSDDNMVDLYIYCTSDCNLTDEFFKDFSVKRFDNIYLDTGACTISTSKMAYNNIYAKKGTLILNGSENTYRGVIYNADGDIVIKGSKTELLSGISLIADNGKRVTISSDANSPTIGRLTSEVARNDGSASSLVE